MNETSTVTRTVGRLTEKIQSRVSRTVTNRFSWVELTSSEGNRMVKLERELKASMICSSGSAV